MQKTQAFYDVLIVGLAGLGLIYLGVAVCADFDPMRGLAGCAMLAAARYMA
jgi:hypothetical protein